MTLRQSGVCGQCRCTDANGCASTPPPASSGCSWADERRNLCSACHEENRIVAAIRARPRDLTLGEFFTVVIPEGVWSLMDDHEIANALVGAAEGLRTPTDLRDARRRLVHPRAGRAAHGSRAMTHWWARCEHPSNCGWESPCYPARAAAVGAAGQHMRRHQREGMAPGVRASTRVRDHDTDVPRGLCLARPEAVADYAMDPRD